MNLMQQITQDLQVAEICTGIALFLGLITIALFFALHIPACLRALTGIGRKREIRQLGTADPAVKKEDRSKTGMTARRERKEQLIIETDIGIYTRADRNL